MRVIDVILIAALLMLSACSVQRDAGKPAAADDGYVACVAPRPEICTFQYDPVCGDLPGAMTRTYGNACTACNDVDVTGYRPGACE